MKATVTSPESWKKVIAVEIPAEDVNAEFDKKVKKYSKEISVPGFRKGKVPTKIVISRFGDSIRGEIVEEMMNNGYRDACVENKLNPVSDPIIEDVKSEDDAPISFTATVEVDPEIEIVDYKGLDVTIAIEETEDKDIDDAITAIREQYATFTPAEGAAAEGHVVTVEYSEVTVDGEAAEGFFPAPQMVEVGKAPLAELNEALAGMSADEEKTLTVTYPEDFRIEEVAGKSGEFTVVVKNVQNKELLELTEEFIKETLKMDDEAALREAIRKDIEKNKEANGKNKAYDEAIDKILDKNDFDVPPARINHYISHIMNDESKYYPNGNQPSMEEYVERYTEVASKSLKRFRILDFIAKAEKIKATQDEVDVKIKEIADQYQQPFETVKAAFRQNGTTVQIREDVKESKALECLVGAAEWPENN